MVIIASKDRSRRVQGSPPGDLRLQVVGSARDGQIVELSAAKCAIGSAAGCTLRLRARGVRPVHCLILRGANGTVARAWAPNTQINGQPFRDALLEAGDRLSIGPVEFEVLPAKEGPLADPTDAGRTVVLDRRPASKGPRREPHSAASIRRARRRAQVHTLVTEVRRLRSQIERAAHLTHSAEPQSGEDVHARLDAYKQQNEQWEATLQGLQGELDSRARQLAEQLAELDAARQSFDNERTQLESELETARNQSAKHRDAARLAEETLVLVRSQIEQAEQTSATELNALRQRLTDREAELAASLERHIAATDRLGLLEQSAAEFEERARQFADERTTWQQSQAEGSQADEELKQARAAFEARQVEAWRELEEERTNAAALESTHREGLAEIERRAATLTDTERELAERLAALSAAEANLQNERHSLTNDRVAQEAELRERADELHRHAAELTTKENDINDRTANLQAASSAPAAEPDSSAVQELAVRQAELEQRLADFDRERQQWEAGLTSRTEQFERTQEEFQTERRQFEVARESHEHQLRERTLELEDRQRQLTAEVEAPPVAAATDSEDRANVDELRTEIEQARAELAEERQAFETLRQKTSDRLDAESRDLECQRQELAAERAALEAERQAPQECESSALQSRQPEAEDDAEGDDSPAPTRFFTRPASEVETARSDASADDTVRRKSTGDDEESIEQYMAQLLNRMRGGAGGQVPAAAPEAPRRNKRKSNASEPAPPATPPATAAEAESAESQPTTPVLDMPAVLKELERRKSTELPTNLNVLREIGITHARSAIETHGQQRSLRQAYGTLATSILCFVAAFAVFYFSKSATTHLTGTTILVVGIFWMGTSMWAVKKVISSMRKKRSGLRSMMEEIEAEIALLEKVRAAEAATDE